MAEDRAGGTPRNAIGSFANQRPLAIGVTRVGTKSPKQRQADIVMRYTLRPTKMQTDSPFRSSEL